MKTLICLLSILTLQFSFCQSSTIQKLTQIENSYPFFTPDGSGIVFQSNRTGNWELYYMNSDGKEVRSLTSNGFNNMTPTISPDGERIAFISNIDGDNDVYLMDFNGNIIDKITHNNHADYHPAWSADGTKITYGSGVNDEETEIFEFNLVTRKVLQLTSNNYFDSFSNYSPDGKKIVFIKWFPNENGELHILDLDTKKETRLTNTPVFEGHCVWSKSGKEVYYSFYNSKTKNWDIAKINVETKKIDIIVDSPLNDARPQFNNSNSVMVFNQEKDGDMGISTQKL